MILKNIKTFFKHLLRNKLYAFITLFGFAVSLMFVLLLSIYIKKELSVDGFNVNKDRIFRVANENWAGFAPPSGQLLKDNMPEIECFTRIFQNGGVVSNNNEKFAIHYLMADSTFFKMFSFKLLQGSANTALSGAFPIVLTRPFALKVFGKMPEIGAKIKLNDARDYTITAIMDEWPSDTHFEKSDAIIGFPSLAVSWNDSKLLTSYNNNSFGLYLMAKPNTNLQSKEVQALGLFKKMNWMYEQGRAKTVAFEPLTQVYFSKVAGRGTVQNNRNHLKVLSLIVILILVLSIINYVNLTISQAGLRSKEIAVKKLMGGQRSLFLLQYINESVLLCLLSLAISILLGFVAEPVFNRLMSTNIHLSHSLSWGVLLAAVLVTMGVGIIAGLIPALKIASFNPIAIVKGSFRMKEKKVYSRVMVVFQYMIIIALLISVIMINKQTRFLRNYDLGFNQKNIVKIGGLDPKVGDAFLAKLKTIPGVEMACFADGTPIEGGNNNSFIYKEKPLSFQVFGVDSTFFKMMDMKVVKTEMAESDSSFWLNESAVKALGLPKSPTYVNIYGNKEIAISGVVKDFHFRDLRTEKGPAMFFHRNKNSWPWSTLVKISGKNQSNTVAQIKRTYAEFTAGVPTEVEFFDQAINSWYEKDQKLGQIIMWFTILTIIISVMGLFAMSLYYVQQKTKEIGVRKVNGARISEVMGMLNKDFIKWVVIAFVIACPLAYYAMHKWLQSFAYKTTLSWWIFALAGAIALSIALLTVSWQSWKAATRNPVEALRYE